ncbi:CLUMA_CG007459, isoform A [Clunio marinus]|uniref:CLUMA_CG007459, isoform A n=1 Tax=Clunio marinus TaxID=568069 RepID=A0A1J1I2W4_9DIPT|nr:CLUMA_CG007459, isoform A [Clunio marinus]
MSLAIVVINNLILFIDNITIRLVLPSKALTNTINLSIEANTLKTQSILEIKYLEKPNHPENV